MASSEPILVSTDYGEASDDSAGDEGATGDLFSADPSAPSVSAKFSKVDLAPALATKYDLVGAAGHSAIDPIAKELTNYNPTYDELFAPVPGPANPYKTEQQRARKNMLTGFVEPAHFNEFLFDAQRRTFHSQGYAMDPSASATEGAATVEAFVGDKNAAEEKKGATVFEMKKPGGKKRKKMARNMDAADVEGFTGPWVKFEDEVTVSKPDAATLTEMEAYARKKKKLSKVTKNETAEEKSILHIKDTTDYLGRTFMQPPQDVGVNLRNESPPERCYIPKKQIHAWSGHNKGVQCIRWLPKTAHLLLSGAQDAKIKLWEVYKGRRCVRTYWGHRMGVRDLCFNNLGTEFISCSYDRYMKIWDVETGQCKNRLTTGKIPFCAKYNPDDDKQHFVLSGMQDKKVIQWDVRSGEIVQEYDRHLGAVNTITFFDGNRRFCTTSDDKSLRIWEWEIPVDTKLIQDASLHSMPAMTLAPNERWMAGQAMDNRIMLFQMIEEKLRFAKKKAFRGHMVAGYACSVDFSPDMSYIISGDADGRLFIWDWKTHRIVAKWKAHDNVCIGALWHPHETSKIATCGWDGLIKFWD